MPRVEIDETSRWRKMLSYVGPGILVSVAYIDPGNLQTDLQSGADHKFELLWIVLVGLIFALIIQSRSANLGVATGKHLSEHCKDEYPKHINYSLWFVAEVVVIAADIPQVIGTAFALNLLFNIPIWGGVLLAGLNTLLLLALQRYGIRKLELAISALLLVLGGCFIGEMAHANPDPAKIVKGMFVPRLSGYQAAQDAIALMGALIMPHNLFLHSALVMSRKISHTVHGINTACRYFLIESGLALFFAFIINVAVMSVTGTICNDPDLSSPNIFRCANITLNSASFLLKDALGKWSSKVYAISLLASGQSSTVTGTYAGQYIMQGFLDVKMEPWLRNLLTRSIAITPSLVAAIIGGSSGASRLIIIASMILSFALPFALIPLLKFTSSKNKMGHQKNSLPVTLISWALGFCFIGNNLYFLSTALIDWLRHSSLPKIGSICIAAIFFLPGMMLYVGLLIYLTLRKEATVKCLLPSAKNVITTDQIPSEWELHVNSPRTQELEEDIKEDPQSLHPQEIKNYP
ncbi:metal transporter Nramp7.2-like isoform X2 [Tasmannia lanceolata]|uniref:metal transporter Nramp7.2-like isoform X2 n=1 Tax=Tasmannia lanceolata TaxID=3420 RepID=UPI00406467E7